MSAASDEEILLALRGILLSVSGLPAADDRVFDDAYATVTKKPYQPKVGVPYLTEQFAPATSALQTNSPRGLILDTGLYFVTMFGVTGEGGKAIRTVTDGVKAAFRGASVVLASGGILRQRTELMPVAGQIIPLDGGHSYSQVSIPWEVQWNQP